uniref:POU domain protein n=1 Tax=Elaeophora elaphi TaxID=1147741 RepID=A0A0R3RV41_9BILA
MDYSSVETEQKEKPEMVVHTAHSDLRKTDIETLKDELRRNTPSAHIPNTTFQQVPDINRSLASPCSPSDQRRIPQSTLDNKLLPTPPAYTPSPLNAAAAAAAAAAAGNLPAAIAAAAAAQTTNPFLLAAALGLQQQPQNVSSTLPWINNAQSFTAMLPYLQHLQAQVQQQAQAQVALAQQIAAQQAANLHQQFKTAAAAAAAAHTSLLSQQQQQQLQTQSQWLSPPPSVPPQISAVRQTTTCPSPLFPAGAESTSSLLELTELSPRLHPEPHPPSPPTSSSSSLYNDEKQQQLQQQQQFLFDEDLMIDSLMEERKDLSEKESIAVAVLAGMAACQR